jgi:hypothetical protein
MRTVTFQSVYEAIVRRHGMDPLGDAVTHDTARAIAEHITDRVTTVWQMWDWADLTLTEERAYRQVWNSLTQYRRFGENGFPDEVYYLPAAAYYRVIGTAPADPPVGTVPNDPAHFEAMDPVTTFVDRDQPGMRPMGQVFGVYKSDPSLNGCCPTDICLRFRPSEKGVTICCGPPTTVFIQYLISPPQYTFVPYVTGGKTYVPGDTVFNAADGNCYTCIATNNNQAPPSPGFWALEPVPAIFSTYLKEGAYADSLAETFPTEDQVRLSRAAAADARATANIEGMIDDLLEQGQKHYYIKRRFYGVTWRYDGTIQWPTSGYWLCSEPWSGNIVYPLTGIPFSGPPSTGPGPGVPTTPGLIYLPEIVSLTGPEPSLKTYPTSNLAIDTLAIITIGTDEQSWRLDPGPATGGSGQLSPADYNVVTNNKHWTLVSSTAFAGAGGGDITQLVNGQGYIAVVFATVQPDSSWEFTNLQVVNTTDPSPLNIREGLLTAKSASGFTLQLEGLPDSSNYYLHWGFTGTGGAVAPSTGYVLSGPSSGAIGTASTAFTVHLPTGGTVPGPVTVTPHDGGGGGTFTPTSVVLTTAAPSATFTYTPASYGAKTISVTNSGGLTDPASLSYTSVASTYTLTGPSSGTVLVASTNFTVALPGGGSVSGTVTITPNDSSGGGTFTPTTVNLTTGAPSATFAYTPATTGAKTIGVTNNGGLTNPGSLTYTVSGAFDPSSVVGLKMWLKADSMSLADGTGITAWNDSSTNAYNLAGTATFKTNIVNGKPVIRFNGTSDKLGSAVSLGLTSEYIALMVVKMALPAVSSYFLRTTAGSGPVIMGLDSTGKFFVYAGASATGPVDHSGAFHVFEGVVLPASAVAYSWVDGVAELVSVSCGGNTMGAINLGWDTTGTYYVYDIAEILIYDPSAWAGSNHTDITNYLKTKYGIP